MSSFKGFIESIKKGDKEDVEKFFRKEYIQEILDGWTALHFTIMSSNDDDILRYLLRKGFDVEATDWTGWKCIHMTAWSGHSVTMKTLIEAGCSIDFKDNYGRTPLDLAILRKNDACVQILMSKLEEKKANKWNEEIDKKLLKTQKNDTTRSYLNLHCLEINSSSEVRSHQIEQLFLDTLGHDNDPGLIKELQSKPINEKEIEEWISKKSEHYTHKSSQLSQECLLYRCIYHKYDEGFYTLCSPELVNKELLCIGLSALETAVELEMILYVNHILQKLVCVDKTWRSAICIANKNEFYDISLLISKRMTYLNHKEKNGYSRLHVAVFDNDSEMVEYILENVSIDVDKGNKSVGTALSLAYDMASMACIENLQNHNVNVNTVDKLRQSPLHMAIKSRIEDYCEYLVDNTENLEAEDYIGFNVLERSVMNDCIKICEKLLKKGARYDKYVNISSQLLDEDNNLGMALQNAPHLPLTNYETIYTLCVKVNGNLYRCLLETLNKNTIDLIDGDNNTLLHLCTTLLLPEICCQLILKSAKVDIINKFGHTPLQEMFIHLSNQTCNQETKMIETIKILKGSGASIDIEDKNATNILEIATKCQSEKILLALLYKEKNIKFIKKSQWLMWFCKKYYSFIKELIPFLDKKLLVLWITVDHIKSSLQETNTSLTKILYVNATYNVQVKMMEEVLCTAVNNRDFIWFEELINNDIFTSSCLEKENTLLTFLLEEKNSEFFKLFIKSKNAASFIEKRNLENELPLHICIKSENWNFIEKLIAETVSVNEEDKFGNTPLSLLFDKISVTKEEVLLDQLMSYIKQLITKSADIYQINKLDRTAIMSCTKSHLKLEIEYFYRQQQLSMVTTQNIIASGSSLDQAENTSKDKYDKEVKIVATLPICSLCKLAPQNCVINCGHMFCISCIEKEIKCSLCQQPITNRIKLIL